MTVAFDAQTNAAASNTSPLTFLHTPVGAPRSVEVPLTLYVDAGAVSAVTYGGVALALEENRSSGSALGEPGRAQIWGLHSGIPTGPQTVSITHNGLGVLVHPSCVTMTAGADTEIGDSDFAVGNLDDPSVSLSTGPVSLRVAALYTGLGGIANIAPGAGMTEIGESSNGFRSTANGRQTTPSAGAFTVGFTTIGGADMALVAVAVQEIAPTVPAAPSGLTATATGETTIDVAWTDNSSDETGFRVERSPTGAGSWVTAGTPAADAETFTDTGRVCGTEYFYRVFAVNAVGDSTPSNIDSATTDACPPAPDDSNRIGEVGAIRRSAAVRRRARNR